MQKLTQKIIDYIKAKSYYNYQQWHIGLTDDIKKTKREYQSTNKIVCEYVKTWPCQNKKQAKQILKELSVLDFTICDKNDYSVIFTFLAISKKSHKVWKLLNKNKKSDFLILK